MSLQVLAQSAIIEPVIRPFINDLVAVVPRLLSGLVFLVGAYLLIRVIRGVLRSVLRRLYADEQLIVDLSRSHRVRSSVCLEEVCNNPKQTVK